MISLPNPTSTIMDELVKVTLPEKGYQIRELFTNGYGLSIIPESYGDTFEVAVLVHIDGLHQHITYESGITQDVIRFCTPEVVQSLADRIQQLPSSEYTH